jgi:hypothetical protein
MTGEEGNDMIISWTHGERRMVYLSYSQSHF